MEYDNYTTNSTDKYKDLSMEDIRKLMDECRELRDSDVPDVYLFTHGALAKLRDELQCEGGQTSIGILTMFGIPFESYSTVGHIFERAMKLREQGKKVALISE